MLFHLLRLLEIIRVFYFSGVLADYKQFFPFYLRWILLAKPKETAGSRLANAFTKLGPVFIKFGQSLSTRPDYVGEETSLALGLLRDHLPPFASSVAKEIVREELGAPLEQLFSFFSEQPIAAASVAQVHRAITIDNKEVAVKIRRPDTEQLFARDIKLLYFLASIIDKIYPKYQRLRLQHVIKNFEDTVQMEMDFRLEAAAASELKHNLKDDKFIYIPEVFWPLTSQKVLTTEWVNAIAIDNKEELIAAGFNLEKIAEELAVSFFNQAYRDGFFHADMHQGNVFVNKAGQIVLIDFGITGRLDQDNRLFVAEILRGFLQRDYLAVAKTHRDAGYIPPETCLEVFAQACRAIGEPIVGLSTNKISIGKLLAQLFKVTEDFNMQTQPQLLLLQKTLIMVEGIGGSLSPNVNLWQLAEPWIEEWAARNIGLDAKLLRAGKKLIRLAEDKLKSKPNIEKISTVVIKEVISWKTVAISVFFSLIVMLIINKI
jgi:ubiquinone biosynthesis protein